MRFFALKAKQSYQDLTRNRRKLTSDEISRLSILCLLCQNLMDNLLPLSRITSWKKKDIKRSFQDFESGVLTGCHLCAIVFNLFSSEQREIFKDSRGCSYGVIAWKEFFVLSFEIILRESSRPVTSRPERTVTVVIVPEGAFGGSRNIFQQDANVFQRSKLMLLTMQYREKQTVKKTGGWRASGCRTAQRNMNA